MGSRNKYSSSCPDKKMLTNFWKLNLVLKMLTWLKLEDLLTLPYVLIKVPVATISTPGQNGETYGKIIKQTGFEFPRVWAR